MLHSKFKDIKFRNQFFKIEKKRIADNFVCNNLLAYVARNKKFSQIEKKKFYLKNFSQKKLRVKNRLMRRCVITNRSRGITKDFKISRILSRELMGFGIIPGYKKAVW
jgi:ribosomal protein S14